MKILILENKETYQNIGYQLIGDNYVQMFKTIMYNEFEEFDNHSNKIPCYEGFEILLSTQYYVSFIELTEEKWNHFVDLVTIDNYNKTERKNTGYITDFEHIKNDLVYILSDKNNIYYHFNEDLVFQPFLNDFKNHRANFSLLVRYINKKGDIRVTTFI